MLTTTEDFFIVVITVDANLLPPSLTVPCISTKECKVGDEVELFALDEVIFMPAYVAPHRRRDSVSSPFHRYAMLALATQDDQRLRISTAELDAPDRPYTVDTIARLRQELGENTRLFFVMGADSWLEIETWRDWNRLLGLRTPSGKETGRF